MRILIDENGLPYPELRTEPELIKIVGADGSDYGFIMDGSVCDPKLAALHQRAIDEGASELRHQLIDAFYEIAHPLS